MSVFTEIRPDTFLPEERIMPRRSTTATTTMPDLERQLETDTDKGLDLAGEFRTMGEAEANAKLASNGTYTADPDGFNVRPSEQCHTPSPLGIGCTRREFHTGGHSWSPQEPREQDSPGQPIEQAELPGTPEPDAQPHDIPSEASFKGKDFQSSPGLKVIGQALIAAKPNLAHLVDVEIRYLWKRRGGTSGGNPKLGALQRPGGLLRYFTGGVTFIAWLAADNCRELQLPPEKIEANLYHQLLHAETDPDDDDAYRIRGHSFEGFVEELDDYGTWSADLREAAAHIRLLPLEEAIEAAGGDEADEGEESA